MDFFRRDKSSPDEFYRAQPLPTPARPEREERGARRSETPESPEEEATTPAMTPLEQYRKDATTVAKDTSFSGTLKSDGNLCIEGNFDGELEADATVFIADTAEVRATIHAREVIVAGTLDGTVDVRDRFHAMASAQVSGEINSRVLVVDEGSEINCHFTMKNRERGGLA